MYSNLQFSRMHKNLLSTDTMRTKSEFELLFFVLDSGVNCVKPHNEIRKEQRNGIESHFFFYFNTIQIVEEKEKS